MKKFAKRGKTIVMVIKEVGNLSLIEDADGVQEWVSTSTLQPVFIDKVIRFIMDMGLTENQAISALKIGQYLLVCVIGAIVGKVLYNIFLAIAQ